MTTPGVGEYKVRAPLPALVVANEGLKRRCCAVFVAHGMGQQKPFDTMVQVANGLTKVDRQLSAPALEKSGPHAARVAAGTEQLARLELILGEQREVHIYESYWAPLTEGRVGLADVIAFLSNAGFNGLWNRRHGSFKRWVLGELRAYSIPLWDVLQLLVALIVVGSLVAINLAVAAVSTAGFVQADDSKWPGAVLLGELSGAVNLYLAVALLFGLLLASAKGLRRTKLAGVANQLAKAAFWLLLVATFATACFFALATAIHAVGGESPTLLQCVRSAAGKCALAPWFRYVTWPVLIGVSALVRLLLTQYVGDVAAYVSPHKLDKFDELRSQIKARVLGTARAIYGLKDESGDFVYDAVAVVGHSLGSVIAYDCLNSLLNDDALAAPEGERLRVLERTPLLLTFGSPLDKTAYVFGTRGTDDALEGRSALAATSQPLILEPRFRAIRWTNIFSRSDIISGSLELYDPPEANESAASKVRNLADPDATTWIWAHTEYWTGSTVWTELHRALLG